MKRLILLGPTASGKSSTAIALAERLPACIISADSRQVFKYLDIGTAKISEQEQRGVPHYNLSLLDPGQEDTAAAFKKRCEGWEQQLTESYEWVIYAGGSTLHLQSILFPLDEIPPANEANLRNLNNTEKEKGLEYLYNQLKVKDPQYAEQMDGINRQRLFRALDVIIQTSRPFSDFHKRKGWEQPESAYVYGLQLDREELYERINSRVDNMIAEGLFDEYNSIIKMGHSPKVQALRTVGYREITNGRKEGWSDAEIIEKIKTNSRRYAKRQMTFFKRWPFIKWIQVSGKTVDDIADEIFSDLKTLTDSHEK